MGKTNFKSDKYRKVRGGYSRFLNIACAQCGQTVLIYQKDGPGILKRLYFDRIATPHNLANQQKLPISEAQNLECQKCKTVLGIPFIYKKEKRGCYRLFAGAITKRITSSSSAQTKRSIAR